MTFMKLSMILFEGLTMYALVAFLKALGYRREQSVLYAWCPLLIWEIGSSGHLDSAAMAFIVLALLARYRKQPILTGLFLGLAVMTKFYPLVLLPALFRRGDYKMPATVAAVIAIGYACYSSVGLGVFSFFGGYVHEEGLQTGTRYFFLELVQHLPGLHGIGTKPYIIFVALVFFGLTEWCWRTCCRPIETADANWQSGAFGLPSDANFLVPAFVLAFALMLLFSPHYPWYIAWLIPFFVLVPDLTALAYICGFFYMCTTPLAEGTGAPQFLLNKILYGGVFLAFLVDCSLRRWPIHRPYFKLIPEGQPDGLLD